MAITHAFVSAVADEGDTSLVRPSNWNASHAIDSVVATGGTITADEPAFSGTQTWNNGAVTFTGFKLDITNTASANASRTLDLQKNSASQFVVTRDGQVGISALSPSAFSPGTLTTDFYGSPTAFTLTYNAQVDWGMRIASHHSDAGPMTLFFTKTRHTSDPNGHVTVNTEDGIFAIEGWGSDGTSFCGSAIISANVDGAVTTSNVPARMGFFTAAVTGGAGPVERLRIDSGGRTKVFGEALVGSGVPATSDFFIPVAFTTTFDANLAFGARMGAYGAVPDGPSYYFTKTNHASDPNDATVAVEADESLLGLYAYGASGTSFVNGASIKIEVDGIPSTSSVPARISFWTNPIGETSPNERMRIDSAGRVAINCTPATVNTFEVQYQIAANSAVAYTAVQWSAGGSGSYNATLANSSLTDAQDPTAALGTNGPIHIHEFWGADGAAYWPAAVMAVEVDGSVTSGTVPGKFIFATTPPGGSTPLSRMMIDSRGYVTQGSSGALPTSLAGGPVGLSVAVNPDGAWGARIASFGTNFFGSTLVFTKNRHATDPNGTGTGVVEDDIIGSFTALSHDGTSFGEAANITVWAGPVGSGSPGYMSLATTAVGGTSADERLRIKTDGTIATMGRIEEPLVALTDGATVALNSVYGNVFHLIAAGDRTILAPTNAPAANRTQKIVIRHEASGANRTLTLTTGSSGAFRFGSTVTGLTATLSGLVDYIGCIWNQADSRWDVVSYSKGF